MRTTIFIQLLFGIGIATTVLSIRLMPLSSKKTIARPSTFNVTVDSDFAVRFFYQLLSSSNNGVNNPLEISRTPKSSANLIFSPLSIVTVMAAVAEGANGTTSHELYRSLNLNQWAASTLRHKMSHTLNLLNKSNHNYVLAIANRMFVQEDYPLLSQFEQTLQTYYRMTAEKLNFQFSNQAESRINKWVSQVTNKQITSLIPSGSLDMMTRLVLTNAVHFKGEWETMFDQSLTRLAPFYPAKDRQIMVQTMYVEAPFPYHNFERLGFEMVELPYAGSGEVSMFIVLPFESQSLLTVARRLRSRPHLLSRRLRRLQSFNNVEVTVLLPKFKLEESIDLKKVLASMGVKDLFDQSKCDLSDMDGSRELYVSDAYHKAAIEVNEKGTKASAASAVLIKGRSMSTDPVFRADRPFIFFIRHNPSSAILFMGAVTDLPHEEQVENDEFYDNK
ncbi:hypothetical protein CHUAL_003317 [Chamberlinius hualienensis]